MSSKEFNTNFDYKAFLSLTDFVRNKQEGSSIMYEGKNLSFAEAKAIFLIRSVEFKKMFTQPGDVPEFDIKKAIGGANLFLHLGLKNTFAEINQLPIEHRIDRYEKEILALDQGFIMYSLTEIFDWESPSTKRIYTNPPQEALNNLKKVLEFELKKAKEILQHNAYKPTGKPTDSTTQNKLSHKVIALYYVYLFHINISQAITPENCSDIALFNGWDSTNSGRSIYQDFLYYSDKQNRISLSGDKRSDKTRLENFIKVISLLTEYPDAHKIALEEMRVFENKLSNR